MERCTMAPPERKSFRESIRHIRSQPFVGEPEGRDRVDNARSGIIVEQEVPDVSLVIPRQRLRAFRLEPSVIAQPDLAILCSGRAGRQRESRHKKCCRNPSREPAERIQKQGSADHYKQRQR